MDISYCSRSLLRHHAQVDWFVVFLLLFFIILLLSLALSALKSHDVPIQWLGIMQAVWVCVCSGRWMCLSDQCFGPLFVSGSLSYTESHVVMEMNGYCWELSVSGDIASLRGLCHDASAEHGQPEGTGRLENTSRRCCLVLHRKKREWETGMCRNYPYTCPCDQHRTSVLNADS